MMKLRQDYTCLDNRTALLAFLATFFWFAPVFAHNSNPRQSICHSSTYTTKLHKSTVRKNTSSRDRTTQGNLKIKRPNPQIHLYCVTNPKQT